jgi:flagellar hook assembly protein FlgD
MTSYADLTLHSPTRKLLAASYGLSMFTYDLDESVSTVTPAKASGLSGLTVYPNPVKDEVSIEFGITDQDRVSINVYDLAGNVVRAIRAGTFPKGRHEVKWNANGLLPGTYVVSVSGRSGVVSRIVEVVE